MERPFRMRRCGVAGVAAVEAATDHAFARHIHEQFGIGVIERGAQKSLSGRGMVEAEAGDVITVNPGEVHDGAPIGDGGRAWRILYFEPALVAEAVGDIGEGRRWGRELASPVVRDAAIAGHFRALFGAMTARDGDGAALRREEALLMLLAGLMGEDRTDRRRPVPAAIRVARALIDDEPAVNITLADLARASGLGRFQVLRGFARTVGLTPHAYLVQRRVNLARRLIARGTPLAEAALASGFADQSHMTRMFVRTFGVSPGAYAAAVT